MSLDQTSRITIDFTVLSRQQKIAAGAMVAVAVGAFLPWFSFLGISVPGIRGDGLTTLIAAVLALAATVFGTEMVGRRRLPEKARTTVSGIAGGITLLIALSAMNDFAAPGLHLTLLAAIAWAGAVAWEVAEQRRARARQI